ncbi:uncharacterized protein LOC142317413 [Lycorma delicatula]|uniref:uncharacterized protein LOC142317413 n=1 Tax=Lycorma delicatula TaxID=130591 RepID=UPI003F5127AA
MRLYSIENGELIYSTQIPDNCCAIPFKALTVSLDLFFLKDCLQLPLFSAPKHIFIDKGLNAEEELKLICLNSLDKNLVDFIIESLLNIWNKNELQAWKFLTLISTVLKRYNQSRLMEDFTKNIQLSLTTVILISDEKRQKIITELYFRTWDTSLLIKLKREDCWTYLIETNCVEGLLVWLGMKQPPHQFPWPTDLFNQWTITQEMTDSVHNLNCTESTKEILFNSLALQGLFCTESKKNPQKIFKRLAATKTIVPTEDIVKW